MGGGGGGFGVCVELEGGWFGEKSATVRTCTLSEEVGLGRRGQGGACQGMVECSGVGKDRRKRMRHTIQGSSLLHGLWLDVAKE